MARHFTLASQELITTTAGNLTGPAAFSFAFLLRCTISATNHQQIFRAKTAGNAGVFSAVILSSAAVQIFNSSTSVTSTITVPTDTWVLITGSKTAGTSVVALGIYSLATGSWTRETLAALADPAGTPATIDLGRHPSNLAQALDGDLAVGALWQRALSTVDFDALPYSLRAWYATTPTTAWLFDQASTSQAVLDWTGGGANQSAITGTSVATESVPTLSYGRPVLHSTRSTAPVPGALAWSGSSGLTAGTALVKTGQAAFSAASSLAAAGTPAKPLAAAWSASSTWTADGTGQQLGLAATSGFTLAGLRTAAAAATWTAGSDLTATAGRTAAGAAWTGSAGSTMAVAGFNGEAGALALAGAGTASFTAVRVRPAGALTLTASSALTPTWAPTLGLAWTGATTLTAAGTRRLGLTLTWSATGALTAPGRRVLPLAAAWSATGSLTVAARLVPPAVAAAHRVAVRRAGDPVAVTRAGATVTRTDRTPGIRRYP